MAEWSTLGRGGPRVVFIDYAVEPHQTHQTTLITHVEDPRARGRAAREK